MRYHMIQQFCSQVCVITKTTSSLKILHKSFHNSIFLNGQDVETAYLFNNWCIAKPNLGYFSLGNDLGIELLQHGNTLETFFSEKETGYQRAHTTSFCLYEMPPTEKFIEMESWSVTNC